MGIDTILGLIAQLRLNEASRSVHFFKRIVIDIWKVIV